MSIPERLEVEEIDYKVEIGRNLSGVRDALLGGADDWADGIKGGFAANLIHYIPQDNLVEWIDKSPEAAARSLKAIWTRDDSSVSERIEAFTRLLPNSVVSGPGSRLSVASVLLMGLDVEQYPPFRPTVFNGAYANTGFAQPPSGADEAALYEHALAFLDRFIEEASARGLELRHRLDAQSVVWGVLQRPEVDGPPTPPTPSSDPWTQSNIEKLAKELLWEAGDLQKIIDGLKVKRQVIFQGPPGTGKTFVAKRIAEWCREHGGDFRIVQFHPSYSYEDFVEGFRPILTETGQAAFKLANGPLRRIANEAMANDNATFVLVIDEINRGSVAKVLGELYFLLEYRGEKLELQYSSDEFRLPKNLWIIGTMNTTDRTIALVDAALRRRFYFFNFFPDEPPIKGLLTRWLKKNDPNAKWVADLVESANLKLGDRHLGIGPSHFMDKDRSLDGNWVRFVWEQAVIPYIEDQCFGEEERLKEFAYDRLMRELGAKVPEQDAEDSVSGDASIKGSRPSRGDDESN